MRINREHTLAELEEFALKGNGVVVGTPGVGKTYLFKKLAERLKAKNIPFLVLPVDKLSIRSEVELSSLLRGSGNLIADLEAQWRSNGNKLGVILIDGFDAARSEEMRNFYLAIARGIIVSLAGKWNIVISVRLYDALKSHDLVGLFPTPVKKDESPVKNSSSQIQCRNFLVQKLNSEEVHEAVSSIDRLPQIYASASQEFRALLNIPFNLWLMERLLERNDIAFEYTSVSSEVQLLQLFWERRVEGPDRETKRQLLTRAAKIMTEEKLLSARREEVFFGGSEKALSELLSAEVLIEEGSSGQRLAFSHNILFDFAVSRLLIEESAERLLDFIKADVSRTIFLRPSLQYFFTRLWYFDPKAFWPILWKTFSNTDPLIGIFSRVVPTSIIALECQKLSELKPLIDKHAEGLDISSEFISRLFQALNTLDVKRDELWTSFAWSIHTRWDEKFCWDLTTVLEKARTRISENSKAIKECGDIVRSLFEWAWSKRTTLVNKNFLDSFTALKLVPLISATYKTNVTESRNIVLKILSLLKESGFPIQYIYRLTDNIEKIIDADPQTAARIYELVLSYEESSTEMTEMGGSKVLRLTSTRKQDFESCKYNLRESASHFVEVAPDEACPSFIRAINHYIEAEHFKGRQDDAVEDFTFEFKGSKALSVPDYSYIWDTHYREDELRIADAVFESLRNEATNIELVLNCLAKEARYAFFWRRLLKVAKGSPSGFKESLLSLCLARPIQIGQDTIEPLSEFIAAASALLTDDQITAVENSIIANTQGEEWLHERKRLLLSLPQKKLLSPESTAIIMRMTEPEKMALTRPMLHMEGGWEAFDETDHLKRKGVDLEDINNTTLMKNWKDLDEFYSKWLNGRPDSESVNKIVPVLETTYKNLKTIKSANAEIVNSTWTRLAQAVSRVARSFNESNDTHINLISGIVLDLASHHLPEPDPEHDKNDGSMGWSAAPRISAAESAPWLARFSHDNGLIEAIEKLSKDPKPQVRRILFEDLFRIFKSHLGKFWEIIESASKEEKNPAVLHALVRVLYRIVNAAAPEKLNTVLNNLIGSGLWNGSTDASETLSALVVGLAIVKNSKFAQQHLTALMSKPTDTSAVLNEAVLQLTNFISPLKLSSEKDGDYAHKAKEWIINYVETAWKGLDHLSDSNPSNQWTDQELKTARELIKVTDEVITRFYFALDPQDKKREGEITQEQLLLYYKEIKPVLELILALSSKNKLVGIFSPTAHHFMEMLNILLPLDPSGVILLASSLLEVSQRDGYHFDQMAIREMVKLVDNILANFRAQMRDPKVLASLLRILDIFTDVGWPDASRLVWRLDEIFR